MSAHYYAFTPDHAPVVREYATHEDALTQAWLDLTQRQAIPFCVLTEAGQPQFLPAIAAWASEHFSAPATPPVPTRFATGAHRRFFLGLTWRKISH